MNYMGIINLAIDEILKEFHECEDKRLFDINKTQGYQDLKLLDLHNDLQVLKLKNILSIIVDGYQDLYNQF